MLTSNWKLLMVFHMFAFGLWGFLLKLVSAKLDWKTMMCYVWTTMFVVLFFTYFIKVKVEFTVYHGLAMLAGLLATFGTASFYKAMSLAPASVIIPFSALYIIVTVVLTVIVLKEPLSLRIVSGIVCGLVSVILLTK